MWSYLELKVRSWNVQQLNAYLLYVEMVHFDCNSIAALYVYLYTN